MEQIPCAKFKDAMDASRVSPSGSGVLGYGSEKQTGMMRQVTPINRGRACLNCGYVELYLDPEELKKKLA